MCGIVGLVDLKKQFGELAIKKLIKAMADQQTHRGPDDSGIWLNEGKNAALGQRRLSIIDLSVEGHQPMSAPKAKSTVTYNGEIYNFEQIRDKLISKGCTFKSRSDTEILPYLFDDLDPAPLSRLVGMFAFGIWNEEKSAIMLARDAFGKKPLYIYQDENFFAFASEIHSFYCLPGFTREIDKSAIGEYLVLGYFPGPKTIYKNVRMIEPGTWETFEFKGQRDTIPKQIDKGRFFHFESIENPSTQKLDRRIVKDRLKTLLINAVERRLISDVPLGAFLSGGVDSALIASIVRKELGRELDTFSIGFANSAESEHEAAREIAAFLGTRHHDKLLDPDGLEMIVKIAEVLDQPNGDSSCLPTYLLSEFARQKVTVCLSGDGGDELFGGYGRYRDTLNDLNNEDSIRNHFGLDPKTVKPSDIYMSLRWHIWLPSQAEKLAGGLTEDAKQRIGGWRNILNNTDKPLMHRMRNIDTWLYMPGSVLPKVDRMSMQHSLEVRCPLLDREFAEFAMGIDQGDCWIPPQTTKSILKQIASEYLPREWMYRSKKGFGLPSAAWSMDKVISQCNEILLGKGNIISTVLDPDSLREVVEHQSVPSNFSIYQMWPLLVLELWLKAQDNKIEKAAKSAIDELQTA